MPVAAAEEEQPKKEYKPFDMSIIKSGGSDFEDYVTLPAEEAFEAYVSEIKTGTKLNRETNEQDPRVYVWTTLTGGDGKGQKYRADFSPSLDKKSNFTKFLTAVYGEAQKLVDADDLLGRPVRVELSEPWGDKGLQFVKTFKKPTASQKRVTVESTDVVPTDTMTEAEVAAVFDNIEDEAE